jgi:enoyl-CoA hydratase/carnithine racemase
MELALTARTFSAAEAKAIGLVSEVCENSDILETRAMQIAETIALKSPIAVTGTKRVLQHARYTAHPPIPTLPQSHAV